MSILIELGCCNGNVGHAQRQACLEVLEDTTRLRWQDIAPGLGKALQQQLDAARQRLCRSIAG